MEFKQAKLNNGLNIVAEISHESASMAAGFFVRTGSRDETPEVAGVSHFLEHMVFKGTQKRGPMDVNRDFDEMGATYNAFTSEENTVFYAAVLPEFQERVLDLLGDILRPSLRQEDFDIEKNVILEEIAMYQDMPRYRLYDKLMSEHFSGHPLGNSVLGTTASITALKRQQMQDYFDRQYSPANITVVGVGNLDFERFVAKVNAMCSHWKRYDVTRSMPKAKMITGKTVLTDKKVVRQNIGFMSPAPASQSSRRYAAMLAADIMGDATGSRLYYSLIEPGLADEAGTNYDALDGEGAFTTFLSTDPANAAKVAQIVQDELARFVKDGPTDAEMLAAKNKIASSAVLKGELPMGRLTAVGFDWVCRQEYVPLTNQIEILFATTANDVTDVIRQYDMTAATVMGLGPLDEF